MENPHRQAVLPRLPLPGTGWNHALLERLLLSQQLRSLYAKLGAGQHPTVMESLLAALNVNYQVSEEDVRRVPAKGPVVVVANHPFGMLEGAILGHLLVRVRPDVKIMTNYLLSGIPGLDTHCIFVNPFGDKSAATFNYKSLKESIDWLRKGGLLAVFPAGEVSHLNFLNGDASDPAWSESVARIVRRTGACSVPVFFKGKNSVPFHALGLIHPLFRTIQLPKELLNKAGSTVELRIGAGIPNETVMGMGTDAEAIRYLRWRTYLLAGRGERGFRAPAPLLHLLRGGKPAEPVADAQPDADIAAEVARLSPERSVQDGPEFQVFLADAQEIPIILRELGRLRELSFRQVGEGTGRPTDLDRFDPHYQHLFLWNKRKQELVGAYRIGDTGLILPRLGLKGLYTSTLFDYDPRFFTRIGPALELGRSFVRIEYQRQFAPLLLLWKGIARYVERHPQTPVLFGAVSISNDYSRFSRDLMVHFFRSQRHAGDLSGLVKPRRPFRPASVQNWDGVAIRQFFRDLDSLSGAVSDLETDGKGVPILLRQYAKLGGRVLGFNVDPTFSNALDGLILVDLRQTDGAILERYMTKSGVAAFLQHHSLPPGQTPSRQPAIPA